MDLLRLPGLRVFRQPGFRLVVAALLLALALARLGLAFGPALANMQDFRNVFIPSTRGAWHGGAIYHPIPVARGPEFNVGVQGAIDSPVFLWLMWPWTVVADLPGRVAWQVLQLAALVTVPALVYAGLGRPTRAELLFSLALLGFFPSIKDSLDEGQVSILLGLAVAAATLAHQRRRPVSGGIALGLAAAVKLTPAVLLPYFAWRRDWKLCAATVAAAALLVVATLATGWSRYWAPFVAAARQLSTGTAYAQNQSLNGALMRLLAPGHLGFPVESPGMGFQVLQGSLQLFGVLGLAWLVWRLRGPSPMALWTQVSVIVLVVPLLQPFAWFHHYAWAALAIPVGVHLASRGVLSPRAAVVASFAFLVASVFAFPLFLATEAAGAGLGGHPLLAAGSSLYAGCALLAALALGLGARVPLGAAIQQGSGKGA